MMSKFEHNYNKFITDLSEQDVKDLTDKTKLYMSIRSELFRDKNDPNLTHIIPVTLFPSPFPNELFQQARLLQTHINTLLYKVSRDYDFIINALKEVCVRDEFTKKLVDIYKEAYSYKYANKIEVGLIRSDYMTHDLRKSCCDPVELYLVEYNTISASFGAHGSMIQDVHSDILYHTSSKLGQLVPDFVQDKDKLVVLKDIAETLTMGWNSYAKKYSAQNSCIIFVIQENERNIYDHTKIECATISSISKILHQNNIQKTPPKILFLTLQQLKNRIKVDESCGALYYYHDEQYKNGVEVALFYFRSCYTPNDFKSENCWESRKIMELSRSIKVPSIASQLTGTKKVQQLLSVKGTLDNFLPKEIIKNIEKTYTGIYSLNTDNKELSKLLQEVKKNPTNYVLKPQREGGGNNIYGKGIVDKIEEMEKKHQNMDEYIIMDMIKPTIYKNYIVRHDLKTAQLSDCVSELGVWGMYVVDDGTISLNISSGYLIRSKNIQQLDGGIASGRAVLDSVCLF